MFPVCRSLFKRLYSNKCFQRTKSDLSFSNKFLFQNSSVYLPFAKTRCRSISSCYGESDEDDSDFMPSDKLYKEMIKNIYHDGSHKLLVIQPRVKTGRVSESRNTAEIKLSEVVALVETLSEWEVMEKYVFPVPNVRSTLIFGKGNLENIKSIIYKNIGITAILIGVDMLTALQVVKLEEYFGLQVFDRYQIILQIFHAHGHTREAKLQIALAEIPYLRIKLCGFSRTFNYNILSGIHSVGGAGETAMETRRQLLSDREHKLKKVLDNLKRQRHFLRQSVGRKSFPIIAVVGYTNSGKTTLIKALTDDKQLEPQNKLFATLDVTLHAGILPSLQKVLYIDTVGFISDVPITLIESFKATLEDVTFADVIIHVRDVSHPNTETQKAVVLDTLKQIGISDDLLESIIEVRNKIDLLERYTEVDQEALMISATEGTGLQQLAESIQKHVMKRKGHSIEIFRVPNGGVEYRWLCKEATVKCAVADTCDPNYLIAEVIVSSSILSRFVHKFGNLGIINQNS